MIMLALAAGNGIRDNFPILSVAEKREHQFHRGAAGTCKICGSGADPLWVVQLQAWTTSLRMAPNSQVCCMSKSGVKGQGDDALFTSV